MRTKRNPLNEGSLKEIAVFLLNPSVKRLLNPEWTWQTDYISIHQYEAKSPFLLPGLLYVAGAVKIQGIGYKQIAAGTKMWVRVDSRQPSLIDVECHGGQGEAEQVFALSESEWTSIQRHLFLVDKK